MPKIFTQAKQLDRYTFPGSYTLLYLDDSTGDHLCRDCAQEEIEEDRTVSFTPFIHWEGPEEFCCECDKPLISEYGDPALDN